MCLMTLGVRLMNLAWLLMSLGVGLEQELGDEFGGDFAVVLLKFHALFIRIFLICIVFLIFCTYKKFFG